MESYCVRCRKATKSKDMKLVKTKNNRTAEESKCAICGTKKFKFVSNKQSGKGALNFVINKLPIEAHLIDQGEDGRVRRASFAGPGTKLNRRLNPDKTPKDFSKPINKLDEGAYHHDLCYAETNDLSRRNKCDNDLEKVAKNVLNNSQSTKIQKANAKLVELIMQGKQRFKS